MLLKPILARLAQGYTIITPTQRLAREILYAYSQNNLEVTVKPQCYAYEAFLQTWFQQLQLHEPFANYPSLISALQLERLWQHFSTRALNPHEIQQELASLKNCGLAKQMPQGSDFLYTPQAEAFCQKWQKLKCYLQKHDLIAPFQLAEFLSQRNYPIQTQGMIWAFFDCFHPEQQAIQTQLSNLHIPQTEFEFPSNPNQAVNHFQYIAQDPDEEHQQIIAWIQTQLAQGHQRIGIVFPDLAHHQARLKRLFKSVFAEEILHFSLGKTLNSFPMILQAFNLLKLQIDKPIAREAYLSLLLSPFTIGYAEEKLSRIDSLKQPLLQEPKLHLKNLIQLLQQSAPVLAKALSELSAYPTKQAPKNWIESFALRLSLLGFPGKNHLNPESLQAINRFYDCLETLNDASLIDDQWDIETALNTLKSLIQKEIIQAPQNVEGIHIMGWLESSGFIGDALWIAHINSQNLPQEIKYSPYLPIQWQKMHALPRTSRDAEFEIASKMLQRLINAHPLKPLIISYAKMNHEGEPLWASVLLPNLPQYQALEIITKLPELEEIEETYTLPLAPNKILKGGSQLLSAQAKCPFWAFAEFRLQHRQKGETSFGFNPLERGNLIHRALQLIWQKLQDQATLLKLNETEEAALIEKIAHQSMQEFASNRPYTLDEMLYKLEHQQLSHMIKMALELDKIREPFTIAALEERIQLSIDEWPFELRFDRLDRLLNGNTMVIDYKSRLPSGAPWHQDRPLNPQLLMYALANADIHAMLYFAINPKQAEYKGITAYPSETKGIQTLKQDWNESKTKWLSQIQTLIAEIRQGYIAASPESESSCTRCIHRDICRKENTIQAENQT